MKLGLKFGEEGGGMGSGDRFLLIRIPSVCSAFSLITSLLTDEAAV